VQAVSAVRSSWSAGLPAMPVKFGLVSLSGGGRHLESWEYAKAVAFGRPII